MQVREVHDVPRLFPQNFYVRPEFFLLLGSLKVSQLSVGHANQRGDK